MRPKVALLLPSYMMGGAERVFVELANEFYPALRPAVVTMSAEGPLSAELRPGVSQVVLDCRTYRAFIGKLAQFFDSHRPDVVLTSVYATGIAAIVARMVSRHKPRIIVGAHNALSSKIKRPDNRKDRFLLYPLAKWLFPKADAIVCVSSGVRDELQRLLRLSERRLHVIYNPVVSARSRALATSPVEHPWLENGQHHQVIVAVGRLVPQKGFDILLRAFALVLRELPSRLLLIGDGPERQALQRIVAELHLASAVEFLGYEPNPHRYLARADLFVMSSRWEGLGNTLIEALACGCPVVSTDCISGPREILENGQYGTLVPVDDPGSLADAIIQNLREPSSRVTSADRRARAQCFSVDRAVTEYSRLIARLMEAQC